MDFNNWLAETLCPRLTSNHVLILDNARLHKTPRTRELIEASGATLMFLPPYSPDYNLIEHNFANIKRHREYHPEKSIEDIIQMYHTIEQSTIYFLSLCEWVEFPYYCFRYG